MPTSEKKVRDLSAVGITIYSVIPPDVIASVTFTFSLVARSLRTGGYGKRLITWFGAGKSEKPRGSLTMFKYVIDDDCLKRSKPSAIIKKKMQTIGA